MGCIGRVINVNVGCGDEGEIEKGGGYLGIYLADCDGGRGGNGAGGEGEGHDLGGDEGDSEQEAEEHGAKWSG